MRNINPNSVIASSIVDITFFFFVQLPKNLSILIKTIQSQFKMGHQFEVAEREEARRKESQNLCKFRGLWILTTKTLGVRIKSTWNLAGKLSDSHFSVQSSHPSISARCHHHPDAFAHSRSLTIALSSFHNPLYTQPSQGQCSVAQSWPTLCDLRGL